MQLESYDHFVMLFCIQFNDGCGVERYRGKNDQWTHKNEKNQL